MNWGRILLVALLVGVVMYGLAAAVDLLLEDSVGATVLRIIRVAVMCTAMFVILLLTRPFWMGARDT